VNPASRSLLWCAAAFLEQGRIVDRLSRALTASAIVSTLIASAIAAHPPRVLVGVASIAAVAGFAEMYFAGRVGFDAAVFRRIADAEGPVDFAATDAALEAIGLTAPAKRGRPVEARIAGARRLFRFQVLALAAQVLSLLIGATIVLTSP
jgi:hypothetical protein